MKKCLFEGAGVALITPMHKDGSVNYEKLTELVNWQIENNTDAIIACGTTGESSTLSHEEHCKIIEKIVQVTNGRIPVIAGTGSNNTKYAVELSLEAQKMGASGVLVVTPYYNKASQTGLIKHYNLIADSIDIPMIIYDIPSRTGCKITIDTLSTLADHPNIVAVKAASGVISDVASLSAACGDKIDIYSGNDDQIVPIMSLGGKGVISVISNILPQKTHDLCRLYLDGKCFESTNIQIDLIDLVHALFIDVNPIPIKEAMNIMGMNVGPCRLPLCELDEPKLNVLKDCLKKHNII
ncbi:MAG: 4-hydroxy-tetrahydrodipicolinate synthase [Oscillospiraceae bacterium]|nr:4-hydroxy-tetrahydrodipicolinate synthase [Oscillospiraceae bacterium]